MYNDLPVEIGEAYAKKTLHHSAASFDTPFDISSVQIPSDYLPPLQARHGYPLCWTAGYGFNCW